MYSKLAKFVVLLSPLVCCGFAGKVVYSCLFSLATQKKDPHHSHGRKDDWVQRISSHLLLNRVVDQTGMVTSSSNILKVQYKQWQECD